jgi:NADP-dependent 3-hydroxy acid dehydrogenase YdfG
VSRDPVLFITGASSGIGAATARAAAEAGYRVVLAARREPELRRLAEELGGPERALAVAGDVTEWEDQQRFVASALDHFGRMDAVLANAGVAGRRSFLADDVEQWRGMVLTNVLGVALTIRATLPHMLERGTGDYLITSSVGGRRVMAGSLYSATKHAVTAMAESLRQEIRSDMPEAGIRVTLVSPGMVDTPFFDNRPKDALEDADVARAVMYALSQPERVDVNEVLLRPVRQAG